LLSSKCLQRGGQLLDVDFGTNEWISDSGMYCQQTTRRSRRPSCGTSSCWAWRQAARVLLTEIQD